MNKWNLYYKKQSNKFKKLRDIGCIKDKDINGKYFLIKKKIKIDDLLCNNLI